MSYEDLEEARAKRAARDKATADRGKGKRGRPRKAPAVGTEGEVETSVDVEVEGDSLALQNEGARPEPERPLFPWRAPVARMYWKIIAHACCVRECVENIMKKQS
jgi:hypothetical protein